MSFAWHAIRDHLMQTASTLGFQRSFDGIRRSQHLLRQFREPAAVLDVLHRQTGGGEGKNLILAALVRAAQGDGPAADAALTLIPLALWPGLDAIRRRSLWRNLAAPDEVASDILARTTEAIRGLDLQRVNRIAATVLRNVERDMIRARRREADRQSVVSETDPDDVASDRDANPAPGHARLQDDVHALIGSDATLVIRVAIEGFSQAEAAVELGLSEAAARKRYQRATRKLRDALQEMSERMSRSGGRGGFSPMTGAHGAGQPERGRIMQDTHPVPDIEMVRIPGLYRRWELPEVLKNHPAFRIEDAGVHQDGTPLLAIYAGIDGDPEPPDDLPDGGAAPLACPVEARPAA